MNNKPLFTVGEHILVDNANTAFIIGIHTSNLQKPFKVHYIIEANYCGIEFKMSYIYNNKNTSWST